MPDGTDAGCISICGWYVHPDYVGRGAGQLLVRDFERTAAFLNTLSISDAAARSFAKLGWVGPFRTSLRLLPAPIFRRSAAGEIDIQSFRASAEQFPDKLAEALTVLEADKPLSQLRSRRSADSWRDRLRVNPGRRYDFHILYAGRRPFGYFAVRPTDGEAGRQYRLARLHYVVDAIFNRDDPELLGAAFRALPAQVAPSAGALLLCTSAPAIAAAASAAGWLDEDSLLIGARLAAKAPLYMVAGGFAPLAAADIRLTFADSDLDFNI